MKKISFEKKKEIFLKLNLINWEIIGNSGEGGQNHTLLVKSNQGVEGVFRYLKSSANEDIKRFYAELKILTDPKYQHPNIVELLDYTKNEENQWYISKRGNSFMDYWNKFRSQNENDCEKVLEKALSFIIEITKALIPLHNSNVVHRDIKPQNIILNNETPQLIDFGLVYIPDDERNTPNDGAVGNSRFSHDVQMRRMKEVPPWLDIYQLSQLLIWMVQDKPSKDWSRSLHWAFVNYPLSLKEGSILKLRAITSACTNSNLSPANAQEFSELINSIFANTKELSEKKIDITSLTEMVKTGKAKSIVSLSSDLEQLEDSKNLFLQIYNQIHQHFVEYSLDQSFKGIIGSHTILPPEPLIDQFVKRGDFNRNRTSPIQFYIGDTSNGKNFFVYVNFEFLTPSLVEAQTLNTIPWNISLQRGAANDEGGEYFRKHNLSSEYTFRITKTGSILQENIAGETNPITIEDVKKIADSLLFDPKAYEIFKI